MGRGWGKVRSKVHGDQWFSELVSFSAITSHVSVGLRWVAVGRLKTRLRTGWTGFGFFGGAGRQDR